MRLATAIRVASDAMGKPGDAKAIEREREALLMLIAAASDRLVEIGVPR